MDEITLIRMARAKAIEGLAALDMAAEFFPDDRDEFGGHTMGPLEEYQRRVKELRDWIFDESRIA